MSAKPSPPTSATCVACGSRVPHSKRKPRTILIGCGGKILVWRCTGCWGEAIQ